ncbi:MAG: peptidylprolyl isomerase [Prevotella sp.]|nr:peptidylprolyl isomerase [Prevotella sp.]MBR6086696.1 peptidylprolyl isomerase [Prevotella sp.]
MKRLFVSIMTLLLTLAVQAEVGKDSINYIDEVVWVVGDEAILRSDIEVARMQAEQEGVKWDGDPDCRIPEQIAVQKLFLNQAVIDSIEVTESEVAQAVDQQINSWIQMIGSQEKLEEYRKQTVTQMRAELHDEFKNREISSRMRKKLVEDVKVTPADVRRYFNDVPQDSLPIIPTTVEVQIITNEPRVPIEEINKVKDELRDYTERVQSGRTSFATLARLYSEDPGSARQGGEMDYIGRGMLDPAFAQVAFNLTDPKKISKIVESEFGFHIIQLIDKRGDKIKCRHILRKPNVPQEAIDRMMARMDSIATELREGKFPFEEGATFISDDKDTRNNKGLMSNVTEAGRTSRFEMKDLPTEIARVVDTLKVGQVSAPFTMINSRGKTTCVIAKLKNRTESHRAKITEDFQVMSNIVLEKERQKVLREWIQKKIKDTYVRMDDRYKGCDFEYDGWVR